LIRNDRSAGLPLLRFFAPSAHAGHAALSGRATSRTFPLRRLITPLRNSPPSARSFAARSSHGGVPLPADFALPGRIRDLSRIHSRSYPAAPMGFSLRGFHPVRKASGLLGALPGPHAVQPSVLTRLFLSRDQPHKTLISRADAPLIHPLVTDGWSRALKPRLPGFFLPDDPRCAQS